MSDERLPIGTRVEVTEAAYENGVYPRRLAPIYGTVAGRPRDSQRVLVRRDGYKTAHYYHISFWRATDTAKADDETDRR